ncbi:ATP-binding protein [Aquimarina intermedia]|uniref:histidine kinase n=1 Tax=Aquimarina intermedia TaxID=350814 RepID=A0A5S5CFR6_9FLAO|nr:ATP-binding protein [Aquimarina intermedia]TYP77352.1 multi-sensor signal transduction histidine kinase [Aquimarina intermedia]
MASPSTLYPRKVDLTNCDKEPIHILGKIQNHGVLLSCDPDSLKILQHSDNAEEVLNISSEALLELSEIVDRPTLDFIKNKVDTNKTVPLDIIIGENTFTCIAHSTGKQLILELEPIGQQIEQIYYQQQMTDIITELGSAETDLEMCDRAAHLIKDFLEYDRVMIYKFDAQWNGEVVSEAKEEHLESWLGLHYPASDIPQQARKLFLKQGVRMIADVASDSVSIVPELDPKLQEPLDLTRSELRAVSSIHIEYLINMKVGATLTAAIIFNNTLWGLIACHHYSPKFINYQQRLSCKFLTQVFSSQLGMKSSNVELLKINDANSIRNTLVEQMSREWDIVSGLSGNEITMLDIADTTGGAIFIDDVITLVGKTPTEDQVRALHNWILKQNDDETYYTECLSEEYTAANEYKATVSGVLQISISKIKRNSVLWFKPEKKQTVNWGGNPNKSVLINKDARLSPRKSFDKWSEELSGYSTPWTDSEIAAIKALKSSISEIIVQKYDEVQSLNKNLEQAYKELEAFSYSVSHDLRAPLRGIDGFAQIIKEDYFEQLDDYGQNAIRTIINSTNKMNELIDDILSFSGLSQKRLSFQKFSMQSLVSDVLNFIQPSVAYPNAMITIQDDLPSSYGDTAMVFQMLSNLIGNALKYSSKKEKPEVIIGYDDQQSAYFVKDNGIGFDQKHKERIFGVFNRLVGQEYEGSGIGLAIVKRAIEKHDGAIWVESVFNEGTVFYFNFKE